MTTEQYPDILSGDTQDILKILREIIQLRQQDIVEYQNVLNTKLDGRSVGRTTPTAFNDVVATDQEGDVLNDGTYEYKLINDSGTLKWDRRTLDVSWT